MPEPMDQRSLQRVVIGTEDSCIGVNSSKTLIGPEVVWVGGRISYRFRGCHFRVGLALVEIVKAQQMRPSCPDIRDGSARVLSNLALNAQRVLLDHWIFPRGERRVQARRIGRAAYTAWVVQ